MTTLAEDQLKALVDRQQILDCVHRYCLGVDRHDRDMIVSAFHPDAIDDHGPFKGKPDELATWANSFHSGNLEAHSHNITTHGCEIKGDVAHAQSYCLYGLRRNDGKTVAFGCARYVDRFERREGVWKIAARKTLIEWRGEMPAQMPNGYDQGTWDKSDPSYKR